MIHYLSIFLFFITLTFNGVSQPKIVQVSTNLGTMKFRLYDDTPKHRDAFVQLTKEGYYNGTLFYRVIQDFLIQGGSKSSKDAPLENGLVTATQTKPLTMKSSLITFIKKAHCAHHASPTKSTHSSNPIFRSFTLLWAGCTHLEKLTPLNWL